MTDADREKLQKIVGMLGSDKDGERANAARFATAILQRHGMSWLDAFKPTLPKTTLVLQSASAIELGRMKEDLQTAQAEVEAWKARALDAEIAKQKLQAELLAMSSVFIMQM